MRVSSTALLFLIGAAAATPVEPPICANDDLRTCQEEPICGLWLAESMVSHQGTLGLFIGVHRNIDETIGEGDLHVPIYDANLNEWSPWHEIMWNGDIVDDLLLQNHFQTKSVTPGVGSILACSEDLANVGSDADEAVDSAGVKRSDPSAGSFSYRHNFKYNSTMPLIPGQELLIQCDSDGVHPLRPDAPRILRDVSWLEENAVCLDTLTVKKSTIPGAGRGAFSKRKIKKNMVIASSPIVQFDRSQTEILEQYATPRGVIYKEKVKHLQLLHNYVFGHVNSTILLLPYGPGVNFVNHNNEKPNAILDWSESSLSDKAILEEDASGAIGRKRPGRLLVDYVALRDIEPGEEIFLDYGDVWQKAWDEHISTWKPPKDSKEYVSAADFLRAHPGEAIRTEQEQKMNPYPESVQISCFFIEIDETEFDSPFGYDSEAAAIDYNADNEDCLRPCKILERQVVNDKEYYSVEVEEMPNLFAPSHCLLDHKKQKVLRTPASVITITDKAYTADQFLPGSFRHEIMAPKDMYPDDWKSEETMPMCDFELPDLKPGDIQQIRWKESGDVVTENAHIMGMKPQVREKMLEYCDRMGITERFRDLTYRGNSLEPGASKDVKLQGLDWHVQRPDPHWHSNMHWISPSDANAHEDYLRALSAAGFDDVLQQIGKHFGFKGLAAYHVTFIAVSQCSKGYIHYDATHTGAKVFNVIFPLLLANETGPELDVQDDEEFEDGDKKVGRLRYRYDVASMMGDDAYHATSAADYGRKKEMRMAATVYIADIEEDNIGPILSDFTQNYPSPDRPDLLLKMAGKHWKANDPYVILPEPFVADFEDSPIIDLKILPMIWKRTQKRVSGFVYRIGLPSTVRSQLLDYATNIGITERYQNLLLDGEGLQVHSSKTQGVMEEFKGLNWFIQRPAGIWDSNMHWISPGDAATHEDFLKQLSLGGFDKVLESIGEYFELDGLVAYHLSFMGVSHCTGGYVHHNLSGTHGKAFNIIVPLITVDGATPAELKIEDTDDQTGGYRYEYDEASIIGDYARHTTGRVDYREQGKYRLAVSIYIADVNEGNGKAILEDSIQAYPPQAEEGEELLLSWAGRHWKSSTEKQQWWNKYDAIQQES
jgi:hypothetical protein